MSLILDALNRAERERKKTQAIPDLQTMHEPVPPVATAPRNKSFVWLLLAMVVLALAVILYAVTLPSAHLPQQAQEQPAPPVVAPAPEVVVPVNTVTPTEPIEPPQAKPEISAPANEPARAAQSPDLDELYATARAEEAVTEDPVSDLYVAPPVEPELAEEVVSQSVAPRPTVAVRDYSSLIEIPDIGDLPWGFRQEIPSLNYVRHNFVKDGVVSVVINGRAHHAGSTLAPELELEEIYVDGVIFRFKQIRFKLRALNSWINM